MITAHRLRARRTDSILPARIIRRPELSGLSREPARERLRPSLMRSRAAVVSVILLVAVLSACTGRPGQIAPPGTVSSVPPGAVSSVPTGTVIGFAQYCSGLPLSMLRPPPGPITVYAHKPGLTVASKKVLASGGLYRLSLPPGDYLISAAGSRLRPKRATVQAGKTITVNFFNTCM